MTTPELYEKYRKDMRRIADLRNANAVLQWDQETYLPPKGATLRGQQISTLSELSHQYFISEELGGLLQELLSRADLTDKQKRNVERTHEDYTRSKKYPSSFVRAMAEQVNRAFHAWVDARKKNSFSVYEPELDALIKLKKEEAFFMDMCS